jgi:hypothetical protein
MNKKSCWKLFKKQYSSITWLATIFTKRLLATTTRGKSINGKTEESRELIMTSLRQIWPNSQEI